MILSSDDCEKISFPDLTGFDLGLWPKASSPKVRFIAASVLYNTVYPM